jgi:hypothetical protein
MAKKKTSAPPSPEKTTKRKLKPSNYKSFRLSKPIKYTGRKLPSAWSLLKTSSKFFWTHKKILGGILLIYGLMQFILVQGVLTSDFSELKKTVDDAVGGIGGGLALFSYMLGSIGQASSAGASVYQTTLFIIGSLALIWALRQLMAGKFLRIRDAYYKGMYPLVPFILVLFVIALQTIPALLGAWLYSVITANGIAVSVVEQIFWLCIFGIFVLLSTYMICSSLMAMYMVTLPDMTPMKALRGARDLVRYRRWTIMRKILFLLFVLFVGGALLMVPVIMVIPVLAPIIFYLGTLIALGLGHTYIYTIYRELLVDE